MPKLRLTISLPPEMLEEIEKRSKKKDTFKTALIRRAIEMYFAVTDEGYDLEKVICLIHEKLGLVE